MDNFITIYHNEVVIINEIDSYEFVGMKKEIFLLNEILTLTNVIHLIRERLGWMNEGYEVQFEGRIYIGSSNATQIKMMSPVCDEKECTPYVSVVMKSKIHVIELLVRMVTWNNVADKSSRS
jgi:hypothetical protein